MSVYQPERQEERNGVGLEVVRRDCEVGVSLDLLENIVDRTP